MLILTAAYLDILKKETPINKVFESKLILPTDVNASVKRTCLELQELADVAGTPIELLDSNLAKFGVKLEDEDDKKYVK